MNLAKNSIPDDPHSCYRFLVDKDNVCVLWEDKKGLENRKSRYKNVEVILIFNLHVEQKLSKKIYTLHHCI